MQAFNLITIVVLTSGVTGCSWIDRSPCTDLGFGYTRSGKSVCFEGKRIDQESQRTVKRFAKEMELERNRHEWKLCDDFDTDSFEAISEQYTKDKNNVYFKNITPGHFWITVLEHADPATFAVIDEQAQVARDAKHVWHRDRLVRGVEDELWLSDPLSTWTAGYQQDTRFNLLKPQTTAATGR
jgi:hypothetical protein